MPSKLKTPVGEARSVHDSFIVSGHGLMGHTVNGLSGSKPDMFDTVNICTHNSRNCSVHNRTLHLPFPSLLEFSFQRFEALLRHSTMLSSTAPRHAFVRADSPVSRRKQVSTDHFLVAYSLSPRRTLKQFPGQKLVFTQKHNNQNVPCYQKQEAPILEERSIEEVYDCLAERLLSSVAKVQDPKSKYIVGLAGPPGAGKTTLAYEIVSRLNKLWSKKVDEVDSVSYLEVAKVLPMDGFHLYRSQLDAMKDPKEAHSRRGAPWTFDPERLLKCLHALRNEGSTYVPSFDHGVGDPIEDDVFVSPEHRIVIVEGNYLFLQEEIWQDICSIFDEKWFLDIDIDRAMQRLLKRHISTGKEPDVAQWRIEYNDRPNAELIMRSKKNADLIINSVDF